MKSNQRLLWCDFFLSLMHFIRRPAWCVHIHRHLCSHQTRLKETSCPSPIIRWCCSAGRYRDLVKAFHRYVRT
ncbi:hypothetical protein DFH29DRAFT_275260 [Suillus ampliporus]|nr:hypothetical protein DFH29DRAFT_275260 [Suillus ampliporus]